MPLTPEQAAALGLPSVPSAPRTLSTQEAAALGLPSAPRAAPWYDRAAQKLGEGAVPGFNRITAATQAATDPLFGVGAGEDFGQRYDRNLRVQQAQSRQTQAEHPYLSAGLQVAGGVPTALATGGLGAPGPMASVMGNAPTLLRAAQGAKMGAGYGAMYGAGDAPAGGGAGDVLGSAAGGAALGSLAGGAFGAMTPSHVPPARLMREAAANNTEATPLTGTLTVKPNLLRRTADRTVKPTPEALYLQGEGVPLTAGQMNPRSAVGQIEEASTSLRYTGPAIAARRAASKEAWRQRLMREAVAPDDKSPIPRDVNDAMADIYGRFGPQYDAIREQPIPGAAINDLAKSAPKVLKGVDARTTRGVQAEIENALTVLPDTSIYKPGPGGRFGKAPQDATAGDVLKVRENIRSAIRDARQAQDFDRLRLLEHAEDVITETLNTHLPSETAAALRATDRRYAIYNTLEDAAARAGLGGEFGPKQAGAALKKSLGRRAFVHGSGGDVRQLVDAGNSVFESVSPPTGARLLTVGPLGEWLTGPLVFQMNQPRGPMNRLLDIPGLPSEATAANALAAAMQRRPEPVPALAEDRRRK